MKARLIIILCLCLLSLGVWAQPGVIPENEPFKIWSLYCEDLMIDGCTNDSDWFASSRYGINQYLFEGDTVIGNNSYKKISWRAYSDKQNEVSTGYALREDSIRVYVYDYADQKEYVLFDFSLKENDVLAMDWGKETDRFKNPVFQVLEVGDTTVSFPLGQSHYLKVYDTVHQVTDMWLTGVGSASYGIVWNKTGFSPRIYAIVVCINGWNVLRENRNFCYCGGSQNRISGMGTLLIVETPDLMIPRFDCCYQVLAIEMEDRVHILSNGVDTTIFDRWAVDGAPFHFQGVDYVEGDSVEVSECLVEYFYDLNGYPYSEMIITDIRKVGTTPIEKHPKAELILCPNPAGETVTLTATGCNLQKVEILDVNGRVLYAATLDNQTSFRYNVSWMPSGIYFARVKTPCGVLTEKFSVR